jgi:hypothetical protein
LDFALAVWKEEPNAGELGENYSTTLEPARVTQIFNTTIYGGSANLVGASNASIISLNIGQKDFSSLESVLIENGIEKEDIEALRSAIDTDPTPASRDKFGPKISAWIAKMIRKSAEGTWKISLGAAGSLLARAIAKYYGL